MPIVKSTQRNEVRTDNFLPQIEPKEHKSVVVDTKYTPLSNLIVHVEGAKWKVDYYKQVLDRDSSLAGHNPTKQAPYQQYHCIHEYILKVSSPLSTTQEDETKAMQVTGSATCYPPLIANVGDMFVADIGDGRSGIFQITNSEKKSIFKESVYEINYTLVDYATGDRLNDLNKKVVKDSYFLMDFLEHGQNPLLSSEEWQNVKEVNSHYPYIIETYVDKYFSNHYRTFIVPEQAVSIYEHFVTRMVSHWFNNDDHHKLMSLKVYNVDDDPYFECLSIYDAIEKRDLRAIRACFRATVNIPVKYFHYEPRIQSLRFSGMKNVILPTDPLPYATSRNEYTCLKRNAGIPDNNTIMTKASQVFTTLDDIQLIPRIDLSKSYVLSPSFYDGENNGLTHLEIQLMNYFQHEPVSLRIVKALIEDWETWGPLEQFYLTPILIVLMKAAVREIN